MDMPLQHALGEFCAECHYSTSQSGPSESVFPNLAQLSTQASSSSSQPQSTDIIPPAALKPSIAIEFCDRCRWSVLILSGGPCKKTDIGCKGTESDLDPNGALPDFPYSASQVHNSSTTQCAGDWWTLPSLVRYGKWERG